MIRIHIENGDGLYTILRPNPARDGSWLDSDGDACSLDQVIEDARNDESARSLRAES